MKIDGPAAEGNGVGLRALLDEVALRNHEISLEAAALAFTGNGADPLEGEIGGLGEFTGIFNVVPHSVGDFPELPLDLFGLVHGVAEPAVFDPPEAAAKLGGVEIAEARDLRDVLECVAGRREFHRTAGVFGIKVDRVTEQLGIGDGGREGLVELGGGFSADAERGAGEETDDPVARGVDEERCGDLVGRGILGIEGADGADRVGAGLFQVVNGGVEQEREAFLGDGFSMRMVSQMSGLPSGLRYWFSRRNSSITPPSRAQRLLLPRWEVAPRTQSRTSLEALPPRTGRSCTRMTFRPARAAVMAQHVPARPPPTTTRSAERFFG